ncbi:MAG: hypothetical protein Q7R91_01095 [bacterium]|nr:hypothetical protein [bacterium]
MSEAVRLFDLTKRDYPNKRGDVFRGLQVFECWVCGALSNRVVMGGYPGYGVRVVCPNSSECWHHELRSKMKWLDKPHPQAYKDEVKKEIDDMKKEHQADVKDDLEGNPDMTQKRSITNTRSFKLSSACKHLLE